MNGLSPNMIDSMDWNFTACNALTCYISQGNNPYSFPLISPQDTVKLCYDAFIYFDSTTYICTECDSLVYDFMTDAWVLMSMGNPTNIKEMMIDKVGDNNIYDIYGRKLLIAPIGQMYIQNKKMYIKLRQ